MDYEKKYKEALELARDYYKANLKLDKADENLVLGDIFPELAESKDEQHRKWILEYLYDGLRKSDEQFKSQFKCAIAWLEKQGTPYTKRDIDDAYLKGISDTKNEIEKQYEATYQIRKDIATFIFNRGDIKDRAKWMNYLGIKVSIVEKQGEQRMVSAEAKEAMYSKPTWSEEDERNLQGVIDEIEANKSNAPDYDLITYDRFISWLKSLKERMGG